jgi:hypothetical protein
MYEYIGILLGARPILPISRLKVKRVASCPCGQKITVLECFTL